MSDVEKNVEMASGHFRMMAEVLLYGSGGEFTQTITLEGGRVMTVRASIGPRPIQPPSELLPKIPRLWPYAIAAVGVYSALLWVIFR